MACALLWPRITTTENEMLGSKQVLCAALFSAGLMLSASAQTSASKSATGSATSAAASSEHGGKAGVAAADRTFTEKAAVGGMAEVEMGKLAQQKASNDQVKQFGQRMVTDHSKANDELKTIASAKGIELPGKVDKKNQATMDRLGKMTGAQFDKAYMGHMVDDHKKDISEFKKEASSGHDSELKGFASSTLPTLEDHLKMAQAANDAVKKSAK
jgi:putative membrane protein